MTRDEFEHWRTGFLLEGGPLTVAQRERLAAMEAAVDGQPVLFAEVRRRCPPGFPVSYATPPFQVWEAIGSHEASNLNEARHDRAI